VSSFDQFLTLPAADIFAEIFDPANADVYNPRKNGGSFDITQLYDDANEEWTACNEKLVLKLTTEFNNKMLKASDLSLDTYGNRQDYSGLAMKCRNKREGDSNVNEDAYYPCWVRLYDKDGHADENYVYIDGEEDGDCDEHKIYRNDCPYRTGGDSCGDGPVTFDAVPMPWTAGGDYDEMATLAFGDDPNDSGALICRLAEIAESDATLTEKDVMPGFCCVDRAFDSDRPSDLWGFPVSTCMC
jgi:hypothetical protein